MWGNRTEVVDTATCGVVRVGAQEIASIARTSNAATQSRTTDRHRLDQLRDVMIRHLIDRGPIDTGHGMFRSGRDAFGYEVVSPPSTERAAPVTPLASASQSQAMRAAGSAGAKRRSTNCCCANTSADGRS